MPVQDAPGRVDIASVESLQSSRADASEVVRARLEAEHLDAQRLDAQRTAERLLLLCEHTTEFIALSSVAGDLLYLNACGRRLLDLGPDEPLDSIEPFSFVAGPDADARAAVILAAMKEHGSWEGPIDVVGAAGRIVPTWLRNTVHLGPNGQPEYVSSIGHDRTEELARETERERLAATIEATADLVTFHDLEGRAFWLNRAARDFFGLHEGERPKQRDVMRYLDMSAERSDEIANALFAYGMWRGEIAVRSPSGERLPASVVVVGHSGPDGELQYFSAVTRDISDRVDAENALRERDEELRESEARYRDIVETQTDIVCRYLPDTTLTFVNRAFVEFYGGTPGDWIGTKLIDIFPESDRAAELARLAAFGPDCQTMMQEDWEPRHDGAIRWYQWTDRATTGDDGRVLEFQSVGRDVHDRYLSAQLTRRQAEILEMVARGEPLEATLAAIARAVEAHEPDVLCSIGLAGGPAPEPASPHADLGHAIVTMPLLTAQRSQVLGSLALYRAEPGEPSAACRRLVEMLARLAEVAIERKQFEDRLAHESVHDPLTRLPNRTLFVDRLALALGRARRNRAKCAVVFLDLDGFKVVNDSLGHDTGDELLVAVARRLESVIRPGDTVARFGGDEFVILCEDLPESDARQRASFIAERLFDALGNPFVVRGTETFVGASVGIAIAVTGTERPEDLLRDADAAMYEAKERGKQRAVVFDDALRERALSRHATFNALHRAIDRGELRVFYQPVVSLATGTPIGAEALVRWQHPERGLVPPSEFIALAEQSDLIVQLGEWVLEEAVRFGAECAAATDEPFTVAVNLAARQLAATDLARKVSDVLHRNGLAPERLCLEITESVLMRDADATVGVIDELQALGVSVSIDDFGTGYSSLAYLKRFPVDSVKIDRSFVDGLPDDAGDLAIVTAVVSLAHALGLNVVAEGVETVEQLTKLVELGCDQAQGYYFARPMPVANLAEMLASTLIVPPPAGRPFTRL